MSIHESSDDLYTFSKAHLDIVVDAVGMRLDGQVSDGKLDLAVVLELYGPDALDVVGVGVGVVRGYDDGTICRQGATTLRGNYTTNESTNSDYKAQYLVMC